MTKRGVLLACVLLAVFAPHAACSMYPELYFRDVGVRSAAMGGCGVALADDAVACVTNPGALGLMSGTVSVVGHYSNPMPWYDGTGYWHLGGAWRTHGYGTVAASMLRLTHLEQSYTTPDSPVPFKHHTPTELSVSGAYALPVTEWLGVGAAVKRVSVEMFPDDIVIGGDGSFSGTAYDVGLLCALQHRMGEATGAVRVGASVRHLGGKLKPDAEEQAVTEIPLPTQAVFGASYGFASAGGLGGTVCGEISVPIEEYEEWAFSAEHPTIAFGAEASVPVGALAFHQEDASAEWAFGLRLGYMKDEDEELSGFSWGFGVQREFRNVLLDLDFASIPAGEDLERPWLLGVAATLVPEEPQSN